MVKGSREIIKAHCLLTGEDYGWFLRRAVIDTMEQDRKDRLLAEGCCYGGKKITIDIGVGPEQQQLQTFGYYLVEYQDFLSPDKLKQALKRGLYYLHHPDALKGNAHYF